MLAVQPQLAIKSILITTDLSEAAKTAVPFASKFARQYKADVYVLHVKPPVVSPETPFGPLPRAELVPTPSISGLQEFEEALDLEQSKRHVVVRTGYFIETVEEFITDKKIDLVVMGTHGYGGLKRIFIGSSAEQVFRCVACPVLTIGPRAAKRPAYDLRTVVFATDLTGDCHRALHFALALTHENDAQLVMLTVVPEPAAVPASLAAAVVKAAEEKLRALIPDEFAPTKPPIYLAPIAQRAEEIVRVAEAHDADLIVMGAHKAGDLASHLPYTVGYKVVSHAPCPVLTVRSS